MWHDRRLDCEAEQAPSLVLAADDHQRAAASNAAVRRATRELVGPRNVVHPDDETGGVEALGEHLEVVRSE
jgi:hypothetical protein